MIVIALSIICCGGGKGGGGGGGGGGRKVDEERKKQIEEINRMTKELDKDYERRKAEAGKGQPVPPMKSDDQIARETQELLRKIFYQRMTKKGVPHTKAWNIADRLSRMNDVERKEYYKQYYAEKAARRDKVLDEFYKDQKEWRQKQIDKLTKEHKEWKGDPWWKKWRYRDSINSYLTVMMTVVNTILRLEGVI